MVTVNEKMTALADEIRTLSGTTTTKSIDAMTSDVDAANIEIAEQTELLEQIATALEGKTSGGDPVLQEKTVSPSTSSQTVIPDSDYNGLSKVTVNAMPTATQATPTISVSTSGKITASATQSAGYVTSGTKSATQQLTTQSGTTIIPSKSTQTAVAQGRYTTGNVTVAAIPDSYIMPSGTKTVTTNGTHNVSSYINVEVAVPEPSGTLSITENGLYDIADYADVDVNVESSGGSGGASVDTCTVVLSINKDESTSNSTALVGVTQYSNGSFVSSYDFIDMTSAITISNIVCGSALFICSSGSYADIFSSNYCQYEMDVYGSLVIQVSVPANGIDNVELILE